MGVCSAKPKKKQAPVNASQNQQPSNINVVQEFEVRAKDITIQKEQLQSMDSFRSLKVPVGLNIKASSKFRPKESNLTQNNPAPSPGQFKSNESAVDMVIENRVIKRQKSLGLQIIASEDDGKQVEHFTKDPKKKMSDEDYESISKALDQTKLFYTLTAEEKQALSHQMFYCHINPNKELFKQGDKASCFFIIDKGSLQVIQEKNVIKELHDGDCFGEIALLYNQMRTASIVATKKTYLWGLTRAQFKQVMWSINEKIFGENIKLVEQVEILQALQEEQKEALCNMAITLTFKMGDTIFNEGDLAQSLQIVKEGSATSYLMDKEQQVYKTGESYGGEYLIQQGKRKFTLKASSDLVTIVEITADRLHKVLGDSLKNILCSNFIRKALKHNHYTKKLSDVIIERLVMSFETNTHDTNDIICESNKRLDRVFIVIKGSLKYVNNRYTLKSSANHSLCKTGHLFGMEQFAKKNEEMFHYFQQISLLDNIIMGEEGYLAAISFDLLLEKIGQDLIEEDQNQKQTKHRQSLKREQEIQAMSLENFLFIKRRYKNQYGRNQLVSDQKTGFLYQIMMIAKRSIVELALENHLAQLKIIFEKTRYKFLPEFIRTFQDHDYIYLLSSYVQGQNFNSVLQELNILNLKDTRFYTANLLLIIEYLHTHKIILRDLNPERFIVDFKGYIKANDISSAKQTQQGRTNTTIGSPHYFAPEVIDGKGYGYAVDLWALGVCTYEFICGKVPFGADFDDPIRIYEAIKQGKFTIPKSILTDKKAISFINRLLSQIPERRLGGSYAILKAHSFFDPLNWDQLQQETLPAPYTPLKENYECNDVKQRILECQYLTQTRHEKDRYNPSDARYIGWDKDY